MYIKNQLISQLENIGLKSGDTLMVHSSMRAIGAVMGGPDQVHQAIIETIGLDGTLMMYISCDREYEAVGRGTVSTQEEEMILQHCPPFDKNTARARRDHGILTEFFRSWPGVICSDNPGGRVAALGAKAKYLTENHPLHYGYGHGSPLEKLIENNGKILLLGSDLDAITILHYAEHIAPITEKRIERFKVPLLQKGKRVWVDIEEYDTSMGICLWPDRFFEKIINDYFKAYSITSSQIGNANCYLVDAKSLVDFSIPIMVEISKTL